MKTILQKLTPNKAVNLFFNDELTHAEKVKTFEEKKHFCRFIVLWTLPRN